MKLKKKTKKKKKILKIIFLKMKIKKILMKI